MSRTDAAPAETEAWPVSLGEPRTVFHDTLSSGFRSVCVAAALLAGTTTGAPLEVTFDANLPVLVIWDGNSRQDHVSDVVQAPSDSETLNWVKDASGLTWEQIAQVFAVSRRTIHLWSRGAKLNANHAEALRALAREVQTASRGDSLQTRAALLSADGTGFSALDRVRELRTSAEDRVSRSGLSYRDVLSATE